MEQFLDYDYMVIESPLVFSEPMPFEPPRFQPNPIKVIFTAVIGLSILAFFVALHPNASVAAGGFSSELPAAAPLVADQVQTANTIDAAPQTTGNSAGLAPLFTPEVLFWKDKILQWAAEYELDPNIVATIMQIESCGNPGVASYAGAQGLFQVMPFHFEPGEDMLDPDTNARRGLAFFREQLRYTGGDILLSFAGYNGGYAASGGVYENWPAETKRYHYWASGIYQDALAGTDQSVRLQEWLAAGGAGGCQHSAATLGI